MENKRLNPSEEMVWTKYYNDKGLNFDYPKNMNIYDLVYEENKNRKDNIALEYEGKKIRFGDYFDKVEERIEFYNSKKLQPQEAVTIASLLTPDFVYDFYAIAKLHGMTNLIDPRTRVEGIKDYISEADSRIIVANDLFLDKMLEALDHGDYEIVVNSLFGDSKHLEFPLNAVSVLTGLKAKLLKLKYDNIQNYPKHLVLGEEQVPQNVENGDLTIVHTGGTTGSPKGVVLTHDNYNAVAMQYLTSDIGFKPGQKFMIIMPPWISYGSGLLHMTLVGGMTATLIPKLDGRKMDEALIKYEPQWFAGVPAHFVNMLDRKIAKGDEFKKVYSGAIGGGPVSADLFLESDKYFKEHGCPQGMIPGYALTECSSTFAARQSEEFVPGSVGIPLPGATCGIFKFDEETQTTTDEELGYNQEGEICILSPAMMSGYYKNEELTNKVLVKHSDGKTWIHTGDLGHLDENGFLFVDGRIKELIIRHDGFKVYPNMIEKLVESVHGIETVKVVGISDPDNTVGDVPKVFYTIKSDFNEYAEDIDKRVQDICLTQLSEYYTEGMTFERIEKMPLTPIGKIDYRKLKEDTEKAREDVKKLHKGK